MVDEEVENVLREIRERVRAEQQMHAPPLASQTINTSSPGAPEVESHAVTSVPAADEHARIEAHLTTTARAWDRLPPVVSQRSGWLARLELWFKRRFKNATRWYAWEQINFNAAVHHSLQDTLAALVSYGRELGKLHDEIEARKSELRAQNDELRSQHLATEARIAELEARQSAVESRQSAVESRQSAAEAQLSATKTRLAGADEELRNALVAGVEELRGEQSGLIAPLREHIEGLREHIEGLRSELRERDEHLRDEGRVCFKQLSLETGEAAVMYDRARRQIEARLEAVEKLATPDDEGHVRQ